MNPLRRAAKLRIGLVLAKDVYRARDAYLAYPRLLKDGPDGVALEKAEKFKLVKTMLIRAGKSTRETWLPLAVLWGLGITGSGIVRRHETKRDKKDLARAHELASDLDTDKLVTFTS